MLVWGIWKARNDMLWKNISSSPGQIVAAAFIFKDAWRRAQGLNKPGSRIQCLENWIKPTAGRFKVNTDAAIKKGTGVVGLGWVVRDWEGSFMAAGAICWTGDYFPHEAEALAMREAINWIKCEGWEELEAESDAAQLVTSIREGPDDSSFGLIVGDIIELSTSFTSISFAHVRRSANRVAHELARVACSLSGCHVWKNSP
ncbi:unnamed protein product, partial [Cuscuta epithymum]